MAAIPQRAVFKSQDVCEIAGVQPYVLKSWEAEFPNLGASKTADGPRIYRRGDVEVVLKLKELLFDEGLTLAGARKRLTEEGVLSPPPSEEAITDDDVAQLLDKQARKGLRDVREGLGYIMGVLQGSGRTANTVRSTKAAAGRSKAAKARKAKPAKSRSSKKPKSRRR